MNRTSIVRTVSALFAVAAITAAPEGAFALEFSFIVGGVTMVRDGKSSSAALGGRLADGDTVITAAGGLAVLSYGDGSEIRVMEKSRIRIGSVTVKDSGSVSVISGAVNARFQKLARGSERKVVTPTTVCSVRGTDFLVGVSDGADSRVEMKEGTIELRNPYGRADLGPSARARIGLSEPPAEDGEDIDLAAWKAARDEEMERDAEGRARKFEGYMGTMGERSAKSSARLGNIDSRLSGSGPMGRKEMEKAGEELSVVQRDMEDDALLNESAAASIDGILERYGREKADIYDSFHRIKEESNRVAEQQRKNYEALREVREAYRKAYEEIMGRHRESMEKIKGGFDKESTKPPKR